ncbi:MAG: AAA family ATPase [Actinobacteria bacterium]|nr:AAA family ATPase [Actinomycetota bacterium]
MKVVHINIHNFRGIHDSSIDLFDYNLLVGPNNCGKSTVIDALRAFYEKDGYKFKEDRDYPFIEAKDKESWIELVFSLTTDEYNSLPDKYKYKINFLRVRKYFKSNDRNKTGIIFGYISENQIDTDSFFGAKNVQSGKFGDIIFIPAVSKVDDHTKLSGPSALRDLLSNVLESVIEASPSYKKFEKDFTEFAFQIKLEETADGKSLKRLETDITQLLSSWGTNFQLDMKSPNATEIIKSLLSYCCVDEDHGKPIAADQFGSGFQRHFIYSLIQIGSQYIGTKKPKKTKDFTPSLKLVLFEEPEAFLHPPLQEILGQNLNKLAEEAEQQVICSTHSSHFVSRNADKIPAIIRLKREKGRIRTYQIDCCVWENIIDSNQAINSIADKYPKIKSKFQEDDKKPEMEAIKYFLWLNPDRSSIFFANQVLLVEGPTEQALLNKLIGDVRIKIPDDGIYVLDSIGKYNIHRFMNLLKHMGIAHSVVHDDDNNKNEHQEINQLIQDTKDDYLTYEVQQIPGDLESFLGIENTKAYRKPQHVLFLYSNSLIEETKLQKFCELIEKSISIHKHT